MEAIIRNVRDIKLSERQVLEHVLGRSLRDNQQVIVQIVTLSSNPEARVATTAPAELPEWCNVFAGLSDDDVAEVENIMSQRADLSRPSE